MSKNRGINKKNNNHNGKETRDHAEAQVLELKPRGNYAKELERLQAWAGSASKVLGHATSGPALQQNLVCVMDASTSSATGGAS